MHFAIQLVSDVGASGPERREIATIDRPDDRLAIDDLGLTLAEAKAMLAGVLVTSVQSAGTVTNLGVAAQGGARCHHPPR